MNVIRRFLFGVALVLAAAIASADPPPTTARWTLDGARDGGGLGASIASAGDINADGFEDIIVGLADYSNGQSAEGAAMVIFGGPATLTDTRLLESDFAGGNAGFAVSGAGDVNDDGYDDVLVGAPHATFNGMSNAGQVYVYYGGPTGFGDHLVQVLSGDHEVANLGASVSAAGDFNGDGVDDVVVGAPVYPSANGYNMGKAFIYYGHRAGSAGTGGLSAMPDRTISGQIDGILFGTAVRGMGDVNGDGYDDVAIGAPRYGQAEGRVSIVFGWPQAGGPAALHRASGINAASMGATIASPADLDNDGHVDIVVGAPGLNTATATGAGGIVAFLSEPAAGGGWSFPAAPSFVLLGSEANGHLGTSVDVGDLDRDGFIDIVAGAWHDAIGGTPPVAAWSRAYVWSGSGAGFAAAPTRTYTSGQEGSRYGAAVAVIRDLNFDDLPEMAIGAPWFTTQKRGRLAIHQVDAVTLPRPRSLEVFRRDGRTPIGVATNEPVVVFSAVVNAPGEGAGMLQVQVQPAGSPFTNDDNGLHAGLAVGTPARATVSVAVEDGTDYHARARVITPSLAASPWVELGTNGALDADFSVLPNTVPTPGPLSISRGQEEPLDRVGGILYDGEDLVFRAPAADVEGNSLRFEVEVRPVGENFRGVATAAMMDSPAPGVLECRQGGLSGACRVRYQAVDLDWSEASGWTDYGNNGAEADFVLIRNGSINSKAACGLSATTSWAPASACLMIALLALRRRL